MAGKVDPYEILTRLQVLIATSSEPAIPDYLKGMGTVDLLAAVKACDAVIGDDFDESSMSMVVTAKARSALAWEVQTRGQEVPASGDESQHRRSRWPWKR